MLPPLRAATLALPARMRPGPPAAPDSHGEAALALHIHEVGVGGGDQALELVLPLLQLRRRVQKVDVARQHLRAAGVGPGRRCGQTVPRQGAGNSPGTGARQQRAGPPMIGLCALRRLPGRWKTSGPMRCRQDAGHAVPSEPQDVASRAPIVPRRHAPCARCSTSVMLAGPLWVAALPPEPHQPCSPPCRLAGAHHGCWSATSSSAPATSRGKRPIQAWERALGGRPCCVLREGPGRQPKQGLSRAGGPFRFLRRLPQAGGCPRSPPRYPRAQPRQCSVAHRASALAEAPRGARLRAWPVLRAAASSDGSGALLALQRPRRRHCLLALAACTRCLHQRLLHTI